MTKLKAYLKNVSNLIVAAKHWNNIAVKNAQHGTEIWDDGPYPVMEKLIKMNEILLEELATHTGPSYPYEGNCLGLWESASKAIKLCEDLVEWE